MLQIDKVEAREDKNFKARYGMQVSNKSILVLAEIEDRIPGAIIGKKKKGRKKKQKKNRKGIDRQDRRKREEIIL